MVYESQEKVKTGMSYAAGDTILPAVAGKSYRIKAVSMSAISAVGETGDCINVYAVNALDGSSSSFARAFIAPGVANSINYVMTGMNVITKPGTKVHMDYGGSTLGDFSKVSITLIYTEIDQ